MYSSYKYVAADAALIVFNSVCFPGCVTNPSSADRAERKLRYRAFLQLFGVFGKLEGFHYFLQVAV